jgi:hypothetical protein
VVADIDEKVTPSSATNAALLCHPFFTLGQFCYGPPTLSIKIDVLPHRGHSSQLVFDANTRSAQFLTTRAGSAVISHSLGVTQASVKSGVRMLPWRARLSNPE